MHVNVTPHFREGYEEKKGKGKGKEKTAQNSVGGGGAVASGPYVQRVMDDAREDEMEVSLIFSSENLRLYILFF